MMRPVQTIAVFYRDLPSALETFVNTDGHIMLRKDGVFPFNGTRVPRMTLEVAPVSFTKDKERAKKLVELLGELESNNQILGFSIRM